MNATGLDGESPGLRIGMLSERTGCHIETIRYYERVGLLPKTPRTEGGYRLYRIDHLKRLNFIRRARELGFSLDEVRTLLRLADHPDKSCQEVRDLAATHLEEVQVKLADLKIMERVLKAMIARCADGTLPDCPLIDTLFRGAVEES